MVVSDYLKHVFCKKKLKVLIPKIVKFLTKIEDKYVIVVTGVSGLTVGSIIAYLLDKPLVVVRKSDKTHSDFSIEGENKFKSYIIVDDCSHEGNTIKTIVKKINEFNPKGKLLGIFLYSDEIDGKQLGEKYGCWVKIIRD